MDVQPVLAWCLSFSREVCAAGQKRLLRSFGIGLLGAGVPLEGFSFKGVGLECQGKKDALGGDPSDLQCILFLF
jgi:hypothetical protein